MQKLIVKSLIGPFALIAALTSTTFNVACADAVASPLIKQINNGNWLPEKEAEDFRDEMFYQRAVQAYMAMLPALNVIGMRDGSEKLFGAGYNVLPIWKDRMDSRTWVPTPNADVIYSMKKGEGKPDPAPAVANAEQTRIYPLWAPEKDVKPMQFPNASGKRINMMYPIDGAYWTKMKTFVDYEPISAISLETRGVLAAIGIIKGQPFNPTAKQQELLKKAVETAPKMLLAMRQLGRTDKRQLYYKDRQYENAWAGSTSEDFQESYLDVDQQAIYYQYVYSSAPAMAMRTINAGSKYPNTARDAKGDFLNGSNTYKLRLPPNTPAALFWAVTAYNVTDGTMPETEQLLPSTNGYYDIPKKDDGSIEIWFAPKKPEGVVDAAFIQTIPGRNFLVALRLYGSGVEFYDQSWKPDDVVKVN